MAFIASPKDKSQKGQTTIYKTYNQSNSKHVSRHCIWQYWNWAS